jgi:hypothetical protein
MDEDSYERVEDEVYGAFGEMNDDGVGDFSDEDYDYRNEYRFENEQNVFDRVGGFCQMNALGELGTTEADVDIKDPTQRFFQFTQTVAIEMSDQGVINIKRRDIQHILNHIENVDNVKFKNPTAFVLGYWVTMRNGCIDEERLRKLIPSLPSLKYPVRDYDVIRYCNLWMRTM